MTTKNLVTESGEMISELKRIKPTFNNSDFVKDPFLIFLNTANDYSSSFLIVINQWSDFLFGVFIHFFNLFSQTITKLKIYEK